ncbi:MAG: cytochrome P450 [Alphaproteobacteria bacterium]|nr:cytochrome P450 [Alphaproteobacteria bacterium]
MSTPRPIPHAGLAFTLRQLPRVRGDRMGIFADLVREYGDVAAIRLGPVVLHVFNRPEHAQHVLQTAYRNYHKDPHVIGPVEQFTGRTMFTSDGEPWLQQRRLMQPGFHRKRLDEVAHQATLAAEAALDRWRAAGDTPLDMQQELSRMTLEFIGHALFHVDLSGDASALGRAFVTGNEYAIYHIDVPIAPPPAVPTRRNRQFKAAMQTIDGFLLDLIAQREAAAEPPDDLLTMLLEARDEETGEGMPRAQVRNECLSLFSAGHDSTASTLMWALVLLSQHPEVEARLLEEVDAVLADRPATLDDLKSLVYTRQVLDETLRLYPPGWALPRMAVEADVIEGWAVPARANVTLSVAAMHRHPALWEAPDAFRPERFAPGADAERHRYQYIPFGGGPRQCIGKRLALTVATLILPTLLRRVQLKLTPGHPIETETVLGLHAKHGAPMTRLWR